MMFFRRKPFKMLITITEESNKQLPLNEHPAWSRDHGLKTEKFRSFTQVYMVAAC